MDTSQTLSIESFSYSWLVNLKPSFESLDESLRASFDASDEANSFIEMDPKLTASKRFFRASQDFNFDFPMSQTPLTLVHADELISNGFLVPLFVKPLKSESVPTTPVSSRSQRNAHSASTKFRCSSLRSCRRLSKQIFQRYLEFIRPLCQKFGGRRRSSSRTEAGDSTSPRTSGAYSADNWRMSCDSESSIYDAVLHCKRSIGK